MSTKKEDSLRRLNYSVLFVIGAIIVVLTFVKFASVGYTIYSPSSESNTTSESLMFMRYLNHTSWDGVAYPLVKGLNNETIDVGGVIDSSPMISSGYLYVGGDHLWKINATNVSRKVANLSGTFVSSPVISNGYVYIGNASGFYKVKATNFSNVTSASSLGPIVSSSAAIASGYAYVGSSNGTFYQLNATDLSVSHSFNAGAQIVASPAIAKGYVYIGSSNGTFYQLNATDLTVKHSFTAGTPAAFNSSAAVSGSYVYVGSADGYLYQLNASDVSQVLHSYNTGSAIGLQSPAVSGNYVYIGSGSSVYQLSASNVTNKIKNYTVSGTVKSSPAIANDYVYITTGSMLYQLNSSDISKKVANYSLGSGSLSSPAIAEGKVYIGDGNGYVHQLRASNISMTVNDLVAPKVKITYPGQGDQATGFNELSFNVTDTHLAYCWYKINTSNSSLMTSCVRDLTVPQVTDVKSYTWTVWANDTSGNYNHSSVTFSVTASDTTPAVTVTNNAAGSSTPSSASPSTPTAVASDKPDTQAFSKIKRNKPVSMNISNDTGLDLTQVVIKTSKDVDNASVTIIKDSSTSLSSIGKTSSQGNIYQSFKVNTSGVNDTSISEVSLGFKVSVSWISSHKLDPSSVIIYRHPDNSGTWTVLNTTLVNSDSQYYYYTAKSPGFSTYAVFAGKPTCSVGQIRCLGNVVQVCASVNTWENNITCEDSCVQGACVSKSSNFTLNGILGGIAPSFINTVWGYVVYYVLLMTVIAGVAFLVYLGVKKGTFGELFVRAKRLFKGKKNPEVGMVQEFFS